MEIDFFVHPVRNPHPPNANGIGAVLFLGLFEQLRGPFSLDLTDWVPHLEH